MERDALYLRKSRIDEELELKIGEGKTLEKHKKALLKFAKEKELNIVKIYEEVASGESLIHRPKMLELLSDIEQNMFDGVIVMDKERLGRGDMQEQGLILNTFKKSNTKIITPNKTYDLNNEFDEEYSEFEAFMSRREYKMINRRMQGGRIRSVKEGNYIATRPPYGYLLDEYKNVRTLKPHPIQADIVKTIFDMYVNKGYGCGQIAEQLNLLNYPSYTGKKWGNSVISSIIKNPVYIGKVVWKKKCIKKSTTPGKKKDTYTRSKDQWIIESGKHPPLIDTALFDRAQTIVNNKYHVPYQLVNGLQNPFAGLIICKKCGAKMVKRPYTHGGDHLVCTKCDNKSSRFIHVEDKILFRLEKWLQEYKMELTGVQKNNINDEVLKYESAIISIKKELDELYTQRLRVHDLLEKGVYTTDMFLERLKLITDKIEQTSFNLSKVTAVLEKVKQKENENESLIPNVENILKTYYDIPDPETKNKLLKGIIEKIEYLKEKDQKNDDFTIIVYLKARF